MYVVCVCVCGVCKPCVCGGEGVHAVCVCVEGVCVEGGCVCLCVCGVMCV